MPHFKLLMHVVVMSSCLLSMSSSDAVVSPSKRGPYKKTYTKDDILAALTRYRNAERAGRPISFAAAAAPCIIPDSTLRYYHRKTLTAIVTSPRHAVPSEVMAAAITASSAATHRRLLTDEMEQKLIQWIDSSRDLAQPPDVFMIRHKAQRLHYAANQKPLRDENRLTIASEHWWTGFKKRHPNYSLRTPQQLDIARARATQPEIINHFYALLKHELDAYGFMPHQIWAADETGVDNNFKVHKVFVKTGVYKTPTRNSNAFKFACVQQHVMSVYLFCFVR